MRPILSEIDFTAIIKSPKIIKEFYPNIGDENRKILLKLIHLWLALTVEKDSIKRLLYILKANEVDKVALFR